jgi:hypothetical protein
LAETSTLKVEAAFATGKLSAAKVIQTNAHSPMKSAYELAMERLEKQSPSAKLSDEQKREIAEIDSTCKARIAERELFLKEQIAKAQAAGKFEEIEALEKQLGSELRRLNAECEEKKGKVRRVSGA